MLIALEVGSWGRERGPAGARGAQGEDWGLSGRICLQQIDAAVAKHQGCPGTGRKELSQESTYHLLVLTLQTVCWKVGEYQENHKNYLKAEISALEW